MTPRKVPKTGYNYTMAAAATMMECDKSTLLVLKNKGHPAFMHGRVDVAKLDKAEITALEVEIRESAKDESAMSTEEGRRRKVIEEFRKLKIANDIKEGVVVPKAKVVEAFQAIAAKITEARTQSESRDPVRLVGKDLAGMREGVRQVWDAVGQVLASCGGVWK